MKFSIAKESRIGGRAYQQDRIGHWATSDSLLMVVADGMGGHLYGEVAAQVALDHIATEFRRDAKPRLEDPDLFLFRSIGRAHGAILQHAKRASLSEVPRTVIVACVVQGGYAYWAHVGDSRLYIVRHGTVVARTRDHTIVQQLVDQGRIREEAVAFHPDRNKLLQCLGGHQPPRLEPTASARLAKDDIVLLCSDGLWGPLSQRQILTALLSRGLGEAVPALVSLAEARAGAECDNVSVVAMCWGEEEVAPRVAPPSAAHQAKDLEPRTVPNPEAEYLHLSDEDIEKAIDELRAALRKGRSAQ